MSEIEVKEKEDIETIDEISNELINGIVEASLDSETETEATEIPTNEEAKMTDDKNNDDQNKDIVENQKSVLDESGGNAKPLGCDKNPEMIENKDRSDEETELAPGVTLAPQNKEQLDLNLMKNPVVVSKISVPTDDDQGEFLEDTEAIKEIREFINENKSKEGEALKDPELLKTATEIASKFNKKLSFKEALTLAVLTKYFLFYGMALIILRDAVKETGQNWMYYYKKHFIPSTYSSAIKYMKLARIPNIIRYAFLGLERLEKINTAINEDYDMAGDDPIGDFFKDNSIDIDLNESDLENFKYDVDAAIAKTRIKRFFDEENKDLAEDKIVKNNINPVLIDDLIRKDKQIEAGLMSDLYLFSKGGADPNVLLEKRLKGGDAKSSANINRKLIDVRTIEGFPRIISELKSKVLYLTKNTALLKEITPQHVKDLQDQVTALKKLINEQAK